MEQRKTFDELTKGDLLLETIYDKQDKLKDVIVHKVISVEQLGHKYDNGVEYVNVSTTTTGNDWTLPRFKYEQNFRDFAHPEREYSIFQTFALTDDDIDGALDALGEIDDAFYKQLTKTTGDAFRIVMETQRAIATKQAQLKTIRDARKYYEISAKMYDDDGRRRKELTEQEFLDLSRERKLYSYQYDRGVQDY